MRSLVEMESSEDINLDSASQDEKNSAAVGNVVSFKVTEVTIVSTGSTTGEPSVSVERIDSFDFYSCEEAIKRLNDYLDAELNQSEREDVIKHLKICEPCLERFHFETNLITIMRERVCRSVAPLKLKERLAALMKDSTVK